MDTVDHKIFPALLDAIDTGLLLEDRSREVVYVNQRFLDLFGITESAEDWIGYLYQDWSDRIAIEVLNQEDFWKDLDQVQDVQDQAVPTQIQLRNGRSIERTCKAVPIAGGFSGVLWSHKDVTLEVNRTNALASGEVLKNAIMLGSVDAIIVTDVSGRILEYNRAAETLFGFPKAEMIGADMVETIIPIHARDTHRKDFKKFLETGESDLIGSRVTVQGLHADGGTLPVEVSVFPTTLNDEQIFIGFLRDVTRRENEKNELKKANQELEARLAEIDKLARSATTVADFGNMLQSCSSSKEVFEHLSMIAPRLFDGRAGAVYESLEEGEMVLGVCWGGDESEFDAILTKDDCWSLRRGSVHKADQGLDQGLACKHAKDQAYSICVPLSAQGDMLGLLHLRSDSEMTDKVHRSSQLIADQLSLSLMSIRLTTQLQHQSTHDPLTNCVNRRYFDVALGREKARAQRRGGVFALMIMDIDNFKSINDTHGHDCGDAVLKWLSAVLQKQFRAEDIVCRYGGEEFAVLMPETDTHGALIRAEQLRAYVEDTEIQYRDILLKFTVSMGIASNAEGDEDTQLMIRKADQALYHAKRTGKNKVVNVADLDIDFEASIL